MELKINILSNEFVRPSSPTKDALQKYPLSLLDQLIPPLSVPIILYYSHDESSNFSSRLRESLSDTLTMFYPLAGRLNKRGNSIDCNDMGVRYIEAKVDSSIIDVMECNEAIVVDRLLPFVGNDDESREELMAIQVNFFDCGGIAIGGYIPHMIADGCSYFSFINTWATISRGDNIMVNPNFISSSLFPPKKNLDYSPQLEFRKEGTLVTRRFVFHGSQIITMRAKARLHHPDMFEPTQVEAVSAFIWKLATRDEPRKQHVASHMVNLRPRMVPQEPDHDHTFGNLIGLAYAVSCHVDSNLAILARNVREGIKIIDHEYIQKIRGEEGYAMIMTLLRKMEELMKNKDVELFRFSSWCRFPVYEADFGMGKPVWASIASVNIENSAFFIDSKCKDGIEAWVTMTEEDMTRFQVAFEEAINISE